MSEDLRIAVTLVGLPLALLAIYWWGHHDGWYARLRFDQEVRRMEEENRRQRADDSLRMTAARRKAEGKT